MPNDKDCPLINLKLCIGKLIPAVKLHWQYVLILNLVISIGIQVVRLVGKERALRPVLEALFHRMLLLPCPGKRLEPLRAAKELLRSPARLADLLLLSGPLHRHAGDDMAIIRLLESDTKIDDEYLLNNNYYVVG